jgi:lipid-A-disaccharide synthase-like uncharacterized protein
MVLYTSHHSQKDECLHSIPLASLCIQLLFSLPVLILQWLVLRKAKKVGDAINFEDSVCFTSYLSWLFKDDCNYVQSLNLFLFTSEILSTRKAITKSVTLFHGFLPHCSSFFLCVYNNGLYDLEALQKMWTVPSWLFFCIWWYHKQYSSLYLHQWLYSEKKKESQLPLALGIECDRREFTIIVRRL